LNLDTGDRVIIKGHPDEVFEVLERFYTSPSDQQGLVYVNLREPNGHEIVQFPVKLLEKAPHDVQPGQVYNNGMGTRVFVTHVSDDIVYFAARWLASPQARNAEEFLTEYELELDV